MCRLFGCPWWVSFECSNDNFSSIFSDECVKLDLLSQTSARAPITQPPFDCIWHTNFHSQLIRVRAGFKSELPSATPLINCARCDFHQIQFVVSNILPKRSSSFQLKPSSAQAQNDRVQCVKKAVKLCDLLFLAAHHPKRSSGILTIVWKIEMISFFDNLSQDNFKVTKFKLEYSKIFVLVQRMFECSAVQSWHSLHTRKWLQLKNWLKLSETSRYKLFTVNARKLRLLIPVEILFMHQRIMQLIL